MDSVSAAACYFVLCMFCTIQCQCEIVQQCTPHSGSSGSLPELPEAFTATIQANIVEKNYSLLVTDYYDNIRNRGAVTRTSGKGNGENSHEIFDYENDEVISIDKKSGKCEVYPLSHFHLRLFGFHLVNDKPHIRGVTDVLRFGKQFNETYRGTANVRGISCDHWQACIIRNHSSFTLDYYFSSPNWNNSHKNSVQPVRAVINGTRTSRYSGTNGTNSTKAHSFYNVYEFFSFIPGSPADENYEIPRGTFCPGKKNTRNVTLTTPKWFSFESEAVFTRKKTIRHFREFYDYDLKLFRLDHRNRSRKAKEKVSRSDIHDYNTGVSYTIFNTGGISTCKVFILENNASWDSTADDSDHIRLKTSREMFFLTNFSQFGYEGVAKIRGFEADVWSTRFHRHNNTGEMYFLRPDWKFTTDSASEETQILVRWNIHRHGARWPQLVVDVYNFDAKSQDMNVYDISACFSWERKHRIEMSFSGLEPNIAVDEHTFGRALRRKISQTAMVTGIRITNIQIWRFPTPFRLFNVTFILLDHPDPDLEGITVKSPVDMPLKKALELLKTNVRQGKFYVDFVLPDGTQTKLTADRSIFIIDGSQSTGSNLTKREEYSSGLSIGQAVGLAVGMLVIGVIIGVLLTSLFKRYRILSQFSFKRQKDAPTVTT